MTRLTNQYTVKLNDKIIGYYHTLSDNTVRYWTANGCPWDIEEELKKYGLEKEIEAEDPLPIFTELTQEKNRVPGRRKRIYVSGPFRIERKSEETDERFSVYRRNAEKGDPDYSPLAHDAPHYEGPHTPKDMREWANWYAFIKMDDGTYQAALDEAWWWGGSHNDGGTIHADIPDEWQDLPYDEFLENVITLAAAKHYGFTVEMLKERDGLKKFFGFEDYRRNHP